MEDCNTCYKSGMESGDVEFGFFGFGLYSVLSYVSGLPLESILVDLELYLGILQQYQVDTVYATLSALKDLILGLTGHGMNAAQLSKAAEHIPRDGSLDPSKTIALADKCTAYMQLAYFLGDFLLADEMFKEAKIYGATNPSFYYITSLNVFSLLIATACYRETKRKKYRSRAKEALETMKKLMKSKGINITHKVSTGRTWLAVHTGSYAIVALSVSSNESRVFGNLPAPQRTFHDQGGVRPSHLRRYAWRRNA